ncbi:MAG: hypothetical protein QXO12_00890 [Candidatus Pacearchaeota archaeon]
MKIALIGSIIGLLILFYFSNYFLPKKIPIKEINKKNFDDWVIVEGEIKDIKNVEGITLLNLCDNDCITVIVFDELKLEVGEKIKVIGKIKIYRGKREIQAEKIEYV